MVIAIDGPSGSGKETIAKFLASHYKLSYINSGLFYRILVFKSYSFYDVNKLISILKNVSYDDLLDERLQDEEFGSKASEIALIPEIRREINNYLRTLCKELPGIVMDGRDIGSVVFPNADAKIYVTAQTNVRITRRMDKINKEKTDVDLNYYQKLFYERDQRNEHRYTTPLLIAANALILNTDGLTVEEACDTALMFIESKIAKKF